MTTHFFFKSWAEFFFFILMIFGFIISILVPSAVIGYTIAFLCGMMGGRLIHFRKKKIAAPYYIIIIGFIIGYLLGSYYGNRAIIVILFVLGIIFSYYLLEKGYIKDIAY